MSLPPISILGFDKGCHQQAVIELWSEVFGYQAAHNDPELAIEKKVGVEDGLFFVAEDSSKRVVGTVMGGYDGHRGWIYSLAVAPGVRRGGIGSAMVAHVEAVLAEMGCPKINLQIVTDNAAVASFYEKLGYSIEPRISMGKCLRPS